MPKIKLNELDWGGWFYALLKAAITGLAGAIISALSMPVLNNVGVTMPNLTGRQLGVLVLIGIASHLAAVLMKSPLPPSDGSAMDISSMEVSSITHVDGKTTVATTKEVTTSDKPETQ